MTRRVIFLCWGNICRSPMAMFQARAAAGDRLRDVEFTSAGVSDEEHGGPLDPRARHVLDAHAIPVVPHRAHLITAAEADDADLIVAMSPEHVSRLRRIAPDARCVLLNDFNPDATSDSIDDPWYGSDAGFETTYAAIEAALPGLFDELS